MSVYKLIDVVGTSGTSISDAIRGAVERAGQTIDDLQWFEVKEIRGRIDGDEVAEYQVKLDVAFLLHAPEQTTGKRAGASERTGTRQTRSVAAQTAAKAGKKGRSDLARGVKEKAKRG